MEDFYTIPFSTAREFFKEQNPIPTILSPILHVMEKGHLYWWMAKSYSFTSKVAGTVLNELHDHSLLVRATLIAKCTEDLITRYQQLGKAITLLSTSWIRKFSCYQPCNLKRICSKSYMTWGISTILSFQEPAKKLCKRYQRLFGITCFVLEAMFNLSVELNQTYLISQGSINARHGAYIDLSERWGDYYHKITTNQTVLVQEAKRVGGLIDTILRKMGITGKTSATLLSGMDMFGGGVAVVAREATKFFNSWGHAGFTGAAVFVPAVTEASWLPWGNAPPWIGEPITWTS